MMKNWSKRLLIPIIFMLIVNSTILITIPSKAHYPGPYFFITLLAPNTWPDRMTYVSLIAEELPKIGIEIDYIDFTTWPQIFDRTYDYPGPYPIPSYDEGGYDVLFTGLGFSSGLDWDPRGIFDSPCITPDGYNVYQYYNSEMDWAIDNYSMAFTLSERLSWASEMQDILYDDIPTASLFYMRDNYLFDENLIGFDPFLWYHAREPMANWSIPEQTEFHYATPNFIEHFHPYAHMNFYKPTKDHDYNWLHQIYNSLVERTSENNNLWAPWLCESYSSSDGLTYNVVIKEDACWADGVDLTTDDVIYNYQLAVNHDLFCGYFYDNYWDEYSIAKINDKEFTVTFKDTCITTEGGNLGLDLLPKHIWENITAANQTVQAGEWAKNQPEKMFGAGPFMLENYNENDGVIHLKRNSYFDDWTGIIPHFTDVYFHTGASKESSLQGLELDEIDMVDTDFLLTFEDLLISGTRYRTFLTGDFQEMAFNCLHPWFGTGENCPIAGRESAKFVRNAINCVIPRQHIINEILEEDVELGITAYPSACIGFNNELLPYEYDLSKAWEYMEVAGFYHYEYTPPPPPNYFPLVVTSLCCFSSLLIIVLIFMSIHLTAIFRRKE